MRALRWLTLVAMVCFGANAPLFAGDLSEIVATDAKVSKVAGGCVFTEGPTMGPGGELLFSDIPNDRIVQVGTDGALVDFLKPSGKSNGLVFDASGRLYLCQGEARQIARIDDIAHKTVTVLADSFEGKRFNSPNDLVLDKHGGLYFTDPRYGTGEPVEQPVMGVYYIAQDGTVSRVVSDLERPNGILVSPDGATLYVAEPNHRQVWAYPVVSPGVLAAGRLLFTGEEEADGGGPDGMAIDERGNLYCTYAGIVVLNPEGDLLGRIEVPERPANCTFGGADRKTLFITARTSLYSIPLQIAGLPLPAAGELPARAVTKKEAGAVQQAVAEDEKPAAKTKEVKAKDLTLQIPEVWQAVKVSAAGFRVVQFAIPAQGDDKADGEYTVFYFQGGAGGTAANVTRWIGQFEEEGREVKVWSGKSTQGPYMLVDLSGTYKKPMGPPIAMRSTKMSDWRLLAAIIQTEGGPYYVKFDASQKTLAKLEGLFRSTFGAKAKGEEAKKLEDLK